MAEVTQWQVERLCAQTGVSAAAARAALERSGGDLLAAALLLEKAGQTSSAGSGCYSTAPGPAPPPGPSAPPADGDGPSDGESAAPPPRSGDAAAFFKTLWEVLLHLRWEVWRSGKCTAAIPILPFLVLLCVRPPLALVILAVCLFFGCRYRLAGPVFPGMDAVNSVLDSAYALISDLVGESKTKRETSKNGDGKGDR